jgi:hypothetical protein
MRNDGNRHSCPEELHGAFAKYARLVSSASEGAVTVR